MVGAHEVISTIMLNWIAVWVGAYLFQLNGPLQNSDPTQQSVPVSSDVAASAKLPGLLGRPGAAGPAHRDLHRARGGRRLLGAAQPLDHRLRGARGRLQPRGRALRRHQRLAQLHPGHGRVRRLRRARGLDGHPRLAVPHRHQRHPQSSHVGSASSASPSPCSGATRPAARWWRRCCSARCSSGTSQRNLDPTIFEPELAANLTLHHPGPRRAHRQRRRDRADACCAAGAGSSARRRPPAAAAPAEEAERRVSTAVATAAPARRAGRATQAGPASRWASSPGSSRCRRCWCARPVAVDPHRPAGDDRGRLGDRRRRAARSGWGAIVAGVVGGDRRGGGHAVGRRQPRGRRRLVGAVAATLRYATPLIFGALGGHRLRAQRRRERRPRGHDAHGRLLRDLRRRPPRLVVPRPARRHGGRRRAGPRSRLLLDPAARRPDRQRHRAQLPRRSESRATSSSTTTAIRARPTTSRACPTSASPASRTSSFFGDAIGNANLLTWIALIGVVALTVFLFRTPQRTAPARRSASTRGRPRRWASRSRARATSPSSRRACSPPWAAPTCRSASSARSTRA